MGSTAVTPFQIYPDPGHRFGTVAGAKHHDTVLIQSENAYLRISDLLRPANSFSLVYPPLKDCGGS